MISEEFWHNTSMKIAQARQALVCLGIQYDTRGRDYTKAKMAADVQRAITILDEIEDPHALPRRSNDHPSAAKA